MDLGRFDGVLDRMLQTAAASTYPKGRIPAAKQTMMPRRSLLRLVGGWLLVLPPGSSAIADSAERARQAAEQNRVDRAEQERTGGVEAGGVKFTPMVSLAGGYDSNKDAQSDAEPSSYEKIHGEIEVRRTGEKNDTAFLFQATGFKYNELELAPERFELEARIDSTWQLSTTEELRFYTSYLRDSLFIDRVDVYESQLYYRLESDPLRTWLKLTSYTQVELGSADGDMAVPFFDAGQTVDDVFDLGRDEPPSYSKTTLQTGLIPRPNAPITAFAIAGFSRVAFFDQQADSDFDRRANEVYGIGGIRLNIGKEFRIDAGWRINYRDFADTVVQDDHTDGFDLRLDWSPIKGLVIAGKVKREYEETTSVFAIVDDVQTYSLEVEADLPSRTKLVLTASYERELPVADVIMLDKYELEAALTHIVDQNVELYAEGLAKYVDEEVFDDNYERFRAEAGVRLKY